MKEFTAAFGLTEKEAQLFEIVASNGSLQASRLAKLASLPRNTARGIIEKLVSHGLVTRTTRNKTHYYHCENIDSIIRYIEMNQAAFNAESKRKISIVNRYAELFKPKSIKSNRPKMIAYEGTESLEKIYEDSLSAKGIIRSWASFNANKSALPEYFKSYYSRRAKKGIRIHSIHPNTTLSAQMMKKNRKELRHGKISPKSSDWNAEIQVYNNRINIVSWPDKIALIIESAALAETLKEIFDQNFNLL